MFTSIGERRICPACLRPTFFLDIRHHRLRCEEFTCGHIVTRDILANNLNDSMIFFGSFVLRLLGLIPPTEEDTATFRHSLFSTASRLEVDYAEEMAEAPTIEEMWQKMAALGIARD